MKKIKIILFVMITFLIVIFAIDGSVIPHRLGPKELESNAIDQADILNSKVIVSKELNDSFLIVVSNDKEFSILKYKKSLITGKYLLYKKDTKLLIKNTHNRTYASELIGAVKIRGFTITLSNDLSTVELDISQGTNIFIVRMSFLCFYLVLIVYSLNRKKRKKL